MKTTPIEQHLADYLLGLARGPWTKGYNRECINMWRKKYGETVASRAEKIVIDKWAK